MTNLYDIVLVLPYGFISSNSKRSKGINSNYIIYFRKLRKGKRKTFNVTNTQNRDSFPFISQKKDKMTKASTPKKSLH